MIFVDTNYFFWYLMADVPQQHQQVKRLFSQAAQGKTKLFTSTIVIFEIVWVSASFYQKNKLEIIKLLESVLSLNFIFLAERNILNASIMLFKQSSLDLEDCYNLFYARALHGRGIEFATFDKKLAKQAEKLSKIKSVFEEVN